MTRGEAISDIVASFDLKNARDGLITRCLSVPDDCFFVFSAISDYDDIQFSPLILYPDVFPANKFYDAINTATIFGLVHGYIGEESTPFHPDYPISRIQALKVIMGAAGLMDWKDKFELAQDIPEKTPFTDIDPANPGMWWYTRYINKACETGLIDCAEGSIFRPYDGITRDELNQIITKAKTINPQVI